MIQSVHLELYSAPCVAANAVKATLVCGHRSLALYVSQCDALNEITNSYTLQINFANIRLRQGYLCSFVLTVCDYYVRLQVQALPKLWPWVAETCRLPVNN